MVLTVVVGLLCLSGAAFVRQPGRSIRVATSSPSAMRKTAPCVGTTSMTICPARDSFRMLARRYHDERCQNRRAAASASRWVSSSRTRSAAQGAWVSSVG